MDTKTYLEHQIQSQWELQDAALTDLTDDQLVYQPAGTVSPIGVIWLHMVYSEDFFIARLMNTPSLWESRGWKEKFNLETAPDFGKDWTTYRSVPFTVELLQSYTQAVRDRIKAGLKATNPDTLDERLKFFSDSDPKAAVWVLLSQHALLHSGEIAALKGIQGVKGLPF
jgi:uncharacterized damage-inducible protein DinB